MASIFGGNSCLYGWQYLHCTTLLLSTYNAQKPIRVSIGEKQTWKGHGSKRKCVEKDVEYMYIPILKTLQALSKCEDIYTEVCVKLYFTTYMP